MSGKDSKANWTLEMALVLVAVGLTCLLYRITGYKMIVLNLFYLPVVLAAFFLGRYRAGVLALFCVISASVVSVLDFANFAAFTSPIIIGLAITIWGAVLGLTTILVGSLSDERNAKLLELHDAHVGVLEVLSRYLQSANPTHNNRSKRVAQLSEQVAKRMKLSDRDVDSIRTAALLQDVENLEITAKVIHKAMGDLKIGPRTTSSEHTFHGSDLVHSLGEVLTGALPLLFSHNLTTDVDVPLEFSAASGDTPPGAKIINSVRSFDALVNDASPGQKRSPQEAISELRGDIDADHHPAVLQALDFVVANEARQPATQKTADVDLAEAVPTDLVEV